jgi:hypothetical protein
MTSWRDTASQRSQDDLDGLLNAALEIAQQLLDKNREFYPFAIVIGDDGQQRMVAADAGSDRPQSADLIAVLISGMIEEQDQLRAAAIVADVHLPETNGDAIRVTLEHCEQVALAVVLPYRVRRLGRRIDYGVLQAAEAEAFVWPADSTL